MMPSLRTRSAALVTALLVGQSVAYEVAISTNDETRQVCSGMYGPGTGTRDPWIDVVFAPQSRGNVALVIYEWQDARYLGAASDGTKTENDWQADRAYICTLEVQAAGLCDESKRGQFIVLAPAGVNTTIFTVTAAVGNVPSTIATAKPGPFRYNVPRTGYWCIGTVPLTISSADGTTDETSVFYSGVVAFENSFEGHLPAADYPKLWFYFVMALVYIGLGLVWGFLCYRHRSEILPIQHYVSAVIVLLVLDMFAISGYYRYLNASATASMAPILLFIVAGLNSARNSASFFLLCITCMGYSIVRESLGPVMLRVRFLGLVHFVFGVIYAVGTVAIPLEDAGLFLLFAVLPLAVSLTAFLMWTMWSLNATIADLSARKQSYKKQMFVRLHRILIVAVCVITAFFIISSISFSNRLDDDYAPDTWRSRFWLLDGWLSLLYLVVFGSIAFIWRPTDRNRLLSMSDELATDDDGAAFDISMADRSTLRTRKDGDSDDDEQGHVADDAVVFDVGDDSDHEDANTKAEAAAADRRRQLREDAPPPAYDV